MTVKALPLIVFGAVLAVTIGAPFPLQNPALFSIPIGFLGCWLGTVLSSKRTEARHRELRVRAETGVGAEI